MSREFYLLNLWRWKCGLPEIEPKTLPPLKSLRKSEWSSKFESYMRNRLVMGAFRYGLLSDDRKKFNRMDHCIKKIKEYKKTGNQELLVDIANFCMVEFIKSEHPTSHFNSLDDSEHSKEI